MTRPPPHGSRGKCHPGSAATFPTAAPAWLPAMALVGPDLNFPFPETATSSSRSLPIGGSLRARWEGRRS